MSAQRGPRKPTKLYGLTRVRLYLFIRATKARRCSRRCRPSSANVSSSTSPCATGSPPSALAFNGCSTKAFASFWCCLCTRSTAAQPVDPPSMPSLRTLLVDAGYLTCSLSPATTTKRATSKLSRPASGNIGTPTAKPTRCCSPTTVSLAGISTKAIRTTAIARRRRVSSRRHWG